MLGTPLSFPMPVRSCRTISGGLWITVSVKASKSEDGVVSLYDSKFRGRQLGCHL